MVNTSVLVSNFLLFLAVRLASSATANSTTMNAGLNASSLATTSKPISSNATPNIELVSFHSMSRCSKNYLVALTDSTTLEFQITGNNSHYTFDPVNGPKFRHVKNSTTYKDCGSFQSQACIEELKAADVCSLKAINATHFLVSFTKTAELDCSHGSFFLEWPGGLGTITSKIYKFPMIREVDDTISGTPEILLIVAAVFCGIIVLGWPSYCFINQYKQAKREYEAKEQIPKEQHVAFDLKKTLPDVTSAKSSEESSVSSMSSKQVESESSNFTSRASSLESRQSARAR